MEDYIINEKDGFFYIEKDGEIYYNIGYMIQISENYIGHYWYYDTSTTKLSIFNNLSERGILIDDVEYWLYKGIMFISNSYYENTILPLII